jgi:hypothetical protein
MSKKLKDKMFGRGLKLDHAKKFTKVVTGNPKREGSLSATRFALYRGCKTVGDVVEKFEANGYTPRAAYADMRWDSKREFIRLG